MAEEKLGVANEILRQLGGNHFRAMTGAHGFVGGSDFLMFQIPKNQSKANKVKITLTPSDTYRMEFHRIKDADAEHIHTHEDLYNDNLQDAFTRTTGMLTSLGTMGKKGEMKEDIEKSLTQAEALFEANPGQKPGLVHARLETPHFTFDAYGRTEEEARDAMRRGWETHKRHTSARYEWDDLKDGVNILQAHFGRAYRDGEPLE